MVICTHFGFSEVSFDTALVLSYPESCRDRTDGPPNAQQALLSGRNNKTYCNCTTQNIADLPHTKACTLESYSENS